MSLKPVNCHIKTCNGHLVYLLIHLWVTCVWWENYQHWHLLN